jgi:hypothetical protein
MTALAPAAVGSLYKLPAMRIVFMAICAGGKGHRRFEIRAFMAGEAWNRNMLSQQRELCFRVIEGGDIT